MTDSQGMAAALLTLGGRAGAATDLVRAAATGIPGEALFYASASRGWQQRSTSFPAMPRSEP